jgi:urea carboxylase
MSAVQNAPILPEGCVAISSPVTGSVWQLKTAVGERASPGDALLLIEAMKMEFAVQAEQAGTIVELRCQRGQAVAAGDTLIVLRP